jgi:steroid delta-isomerase-like uncharacterized protein
VSAAAADPGAPVLELWFDFASTYSYVAALRAEGVAAASGIRLAWRPFLLGPIFEAQLGIKDSPFNVQPARGRHMWRDVERLCAKHGLAWRRPSAFPRNGLLAARVACLAAGEPWQGDLVRGLFAANFAEDRDIASPEVVGDVLARAGADRDAVLARASAPEAKAALREATAAAQAQGFFGAPTFIARGELFFGQDRLEDAIAWCVRGEAALVTGLDLRALVASFYADVWNRGELARVPALLREDFTFRGSLGAEVTGHAAFAAYVEEVRGALGDYRCDILDLVVEGARAFARMRFSGVHRGPFLGFPATGRRVEWAGAALFTAAPDGRIADLWVLGDVARLRARLEADARG